MKFLQKARIGAKRAVLGLLCILVAVHGGGQLMSTDAYDTVLADQRTPALSIAVNQIDQVIEQNTAMVEEATAAAASLRSEGGELSGLMSRFQTSQAGARSEAARLATHARNDSSAQPAQSWEEF